MVGLSGCGGGDASSAERTVEPAVDQSTTIVATSTTSTTTTTDPPPTSSTAPPPPPSWAPKDRSDWATEEFLRYVPAAKLNAEVTKTLGPRVSRTDPFAPVAEMCQQMVGLVPDPHVFHANGPDDLEAIMVGIGTGLGDIAARCLDGDLERYNAAEAATRDQLIAIRAVCIDEHWVALFCTAS
jgi:hypothetical protein